MDAQGGLFAFMALYGVTNGLSLTLFGATWPEIYGTVHLGAIRSAVVAVLVVASAIGPGLRCGRASCQSQSRWPLLLRP